MNTIYSQNNQTTGELRKNYQRFAENIKQSGKDPKALLDELVSSGKVSQEQLKKAESMARMFAKFIN